LGDHRIRQVWARTNLWLLKVVCGIDVEITGAEKIRRGR